ncbi:MAG TPA: iron-containing alcohol dehydrogenase [Leadbetterella sp.]|nr:iron-containing alcohol dehydrogenase [Leadbetterella sp.]
MISNFIFRNPVKIIFGKDTISQLPKNIPAGAKVLVTYGGGSIFKNGVYEQVKAALSGFEIIEFGGIEPNPTFETLMKAVEIGRTEKIDFILSVGGGSVLDGTKFISAAIPFEGGNEWENIVLGKSRYKTATPFGAVLTLPATGSEMNSGGVISRKETHEKYGMGSPLLYPQFSILDPTTTYSLPKVQIANGLADAFTHVMEQYLTYPVNALIQDKFAESVLKTLIEVAPKVMHDQTNYEDMSNFMWAATVALNGWISLGVPGDWATHQIGHELTALHGIDHARTLAVVLPHLMRYKMDTKKAKMIQYAKEVWGQAGSDDELAEAAIQKTIEFYESLGIPTKASSYGIGEETVQEIKKRFTDRKVRYGENSDIDATATDAILRMSIS